MKRVIIFFTLAFLAFSLIQSCRHYPDEILPHPGGNDTTKIDTTVTTKHPCSPDTVYYARDIQPLFNTYCVGSGCHNLPSPAEGLNLTSYSDAIKSSKIKPYNAGGSKVYQALVASGGDRMPPSGSLSSDQIALIQKWINQGAKNLWCDEIAGPCDTANVKYSTTIVSILTANCTSCHGISGGGGVILTNYSGVKTVVNNSKLWNSINHLSGTTKSMPSSTTKLSACNLRQIKIWIDAGAPQN